MSSVGTPPSVGSFITKSVTGSAVCQASSETDPSTVMAPLSTRTAAARLSGRACGTAGDWARAALPPGRATSRLARMAKRIEDGITSQEASGA